MNPLWLTETSGGILVRLHVQPGARRSEIAGEHGDRLKVRIAAPPVDGAANEEVIRLLSELTGVARARIRILRGEISRAKDVVFADAEYEEIRTALTNPAAD